MDTFLFPVINIKTFLMDVTGFAVANGNFCGEVKICFAVSNKMPDGKVNKTKFYYYKIVIITLILCLLL